MLTGNRVIDSIREEASMAKILIPTPLRQFAAGQDAVAVEAATVGEALSQLVATHPQIERNLFTEQGRLRSFVNVYVDDDDIRYLDREETPVQAGSTITIVPSIAGGALPAPACDAGRGHAAAPFAGGDPALQSPPHTA